MAAPELVDEPIPDPDAVLTADDPVVEQPSAPDAPMDAIQGLALDHPVLPDPTPQPENYHVAIWDTPVTFACLRCMARGLTLAEVTYHLDAAHGEAAVPTPLAAQYTPPLYGATEQAQAPPATGEEALARLGRVPSVEAGGASVSEETIRDERSPDDGELLAGASPGDEPGDTPGSESRAGGRDQREPDV